MTFVLSEDQEMLRDTAINFAKDTLPVSHLRDLRAAGAHGISDRSHSGLSEMGFYGVLVPESHGGSGFGMVGMGQILEALGRTITPNALIPSAVIAASAIERAGSTAQKDEWLPKLASGEAVFAFALDEGRHHAPTQIATEAESNGQGHTLTGAKRFVPSAQGATHLLVVARSFGEPGQEHGLSLFIVPTHADGLTVSPLNTVDSHGAAHVSLDDVHVGKDGLIGEADTAFEVIDAVLDLARIAQSAEILGSAQAAFELTLDYMNTRRQFGQLIGSFQALQHRMAIQFTELEMTRSCVAAALSAAENNTKDTPRLASLAKARTSDLIHLVSNETVQLHGGIGMTDEHDSGLYMKRARVQEALYGGASFHRDRYARLQGF
ncbi:MAG: acyl-CoA dehydrogenase family protein [Pseudomonadota bacterium]